MQKTCLTAFAFLSFGFAQAQDVPQFDARQKFELLRQQAAELRQAEVLQRLNEIEGFRPLGGANDQQQQQQVINLGDIVIDVATAKALGSGPEAQLTLAKLKGKGPNTGTTHYTETLTRQTIVNGQVREQKYAVQLPVTSEVLPNGNIGPEGQDRSIPVASVQAFDLKGNSLDVAEWTKQLETPKQVLLIREPISESNKLNPFYVAILRKDTILLYLKGGQANNESQREILSTKVYDLSDLDVWRNDGDDSRPIVFLKSLKSQVTPKAWDTSRASLMELPGNQGIVVTADAVTHKELTKYFQDLRLKIEKDRKDE